ncbi:hypothetical protein [Streptomyces sp. NPDC058434]|uniref:hypothetical protein n=1 Tax=Streptomyces sp. NPDC058434 TaxID=3346498 RepID=UPI00364E05AC
MIFATDRSRCTDRVMGGCSLLCSAVARTGIAHPRSSGSTVPNNRSPTGRRQRPMDPSVFNEWE